MRTTTMALSALAALLCASCMSSKEYMLRKQDMEIKAAHPATYNPIVIKGPVSLDKDAQIEVSVPTMPYQQTSIPDGQAVQAAIVKDVISTSALAGVAAYGIHEAGKVDHVKTSTGTAQAE